MNNADELDGNSGGAATSRVPERRESARLRLSLRDVLALVTIAALLGGYAVLLSRLRSAQQELAMLRQQTGYLPPTEATEVAAVRAPSDDPLTYRLRVRVPEKTPYRIAYSSMLPKGASAPAWYAAIDLPPGESSVTIRIGEDPRDERWKIATLVQSTRGNKRVATVLPADHVRLFRGPGNAISTGIGKSIVTASANESIRLLDERWLAGEGALMLYGSRPPQQDQIGVYAELQPDVAPL